MGPDGWQERDIYLRTAISVETDGWAHFDYVKMPDYRWGIFLEPHEDGQDASASATTWASRCGTRCRASSATCCAASSSRRATPSRRRVEQQRTARRDRAVALRPAQPVPGQRRGRPSPVGDGLSAPHVLRPRRPRRGRGAARAPLGRSPTSRASSARSTSRSQQLARLLHVHDVHRPRRQVSARRARRVRLRSARAHLPLHAHRGSAPHVRRRDRRPARREARVRADEASRRRRARARAASICRRSRST